MLKKLASISFAISTVAIIAMIIAGNLLMTENLLLSQSLGYMAFILFLIEFILYCLLRRAEKSPHADPNSLQRKFDNKSNHQFWLINFVASIVLIVIAERELIFSNAILPMFNPNVTIIRSSMNPFSLVSGYKGNGQGFIIQSFFMNLAAFMPLSAIQYDKIALLDELFFYYIIAASISRVLYRTLNIQSIPDSTLSVIFASFFIFNFIYYSNGYSAFIFGPLMVVYVAIKIYEMLKNSLFKFVDAISIGLAGSFALLGDPRSLVYMVLILLGFFIGLILKKRNQILQFIKLTVSASIVIIPVFAVKFLTTIFTPSFSSNGGRAGNFSTIAFFSSSTAPMFIWDALSNWWSTYVLAPPSILNVPVSKVNYLTTIHAGNPVILYPGSIFDSIWLISLGLISILAIFSLFLHRNDQKNYLFSLLYIPFFIIFILALGSNIGFKPFVYSIAHLSSLPFVGPFWALTISTPQWIFPYLEAFMILFASYSILRIAEYIGLDKDQKRQKHFLHLRSGKYNQYVKYAVVLIILLIFMFSNWQFFDQSNAFGMDLHNTLPGNQVSRTPSIVPVNPPNGWLNTYDSLYDQNNLSYAVFTNEGGLIPLSWDNGQNSYGTPGIPPNPTFSQLLDSIVELNESFLIPTLMNNYGVKYVFFDKTQVDPNWELYNSLISSGIQVLESTDNYTVFVVSSASEVHASTSILSLNDSSPFSNIELSSMLNSIDYHPLILDGGNNGFKIAENGTILPSNGAIFYNSTALSSMFPQYSFGDFNSSHSGSSNYDKFAIGNGWNITRYNGEYYVNYSVSNNSLELQKFDNGTGNFPTSSFNVYLGNGSISIPESATVVFHYYFTYSSTPGNGIIQFYVGNRYFNLQNGVKNVTFSGSIYVSGNSTRSFGFALEHGYNGTFALNIKDLSYTFLKKGAPYVNPLSESIRAKPDTNYTILYTSSQDGNNFTTNSLQVKSQKDGELKFALGVFNYLSSVVVLPSSWIENSYSGNLQVNITGFGSQISGNYLAPAGYIALCYNSEYQWKLSSNLKFVGVNQIGQEIYYVKEGGNFTFSIPHVQQYLVMDWTLAITMNIVLPVLIFTPLISLISRYKRT